MPAFNQWNVSDSGVNKGFCVSLANGYDFSVSWGNTHLQTETGEQVAEVAIFALDGECVQVHRYVTPDEMVKIMQTTALL